MLSAYTLSKTPYIYFKVVPVETLNEQVFWQQQHSWTKASLLALKKNK
jgi:hypothetical protein